MRSLNIGATGMLAQQTNVDVISNNIANMNTTAYTRRRAEFSDLLYESVKRVGANSSDTGTIVPDGIQLGMGVKTSAIYRITGGGSVNYTGNSLDVAIQGRGYFQIELPSGEVAYTRDGSFQRSDTGLIVTHEGYQVQPGITIPDNATDVYIDVTGQVSVKIDQQVQPQVVGQLQLATFVNDAGLDPRGDNLFLETPASGAPIVGNPGDVSFGTILQGYLSSSNVNVVSEITDLISAQRAYEMNSKVIQTSDEMLRTVSTLK